MAANPRAGAAGFTPSASTVARIVLDQTPNMTGVVGVRKIVASADAELEGLDVCRLQVTLKDRTKTFEALVELDRPHGTLWVAVPSEGWRFSAPVSFPPNSTRHTAIHVTMPALADALAGAVARSVGFPAELAPAECSPDWGEHYVLSGQKMQVTEASYRKLARLAQVSELEKMASATGEERDRHIRHIRELIDELGLRSGTPGVEQRRAAAYAAIPRSELVVAHHGKRRRLSYLGRRSAGERRLGTQILAAGVQSTMGYLPAAEVSAVAGQAASSYAAIPGSAISRGLGDCATLRLFVRQAADRVVPRRFLERVSLSRYLARFGVAAAADTGVRTTAAIAAGLVDLAWLVESATRRVVTGLGSGVAELATAKRQVTASDEAASAKAVLRRGEAADEFAALVQESLLLGMGASALFADEAALSIAPKEQTRTVEEMKRNQQLFERASKMLADNGLTLARFRTDAAPTDSIDPKVRALIRVGPQAGALLLGAVLAGVLGNPSYGLKGLQPLAQSLAHARFSESTRRKVARDDAEVAWGRLRRRYARAEVERSAAHSLLTPASEENGSPDSRESLAAASIVADTDSPPASSKAGVKDRRPRPWPYLERALKVLPFSLLATFPALVPADLREFAVPLLVSAGFGPIATGVYWELDRLLSYQRGRKGEGLADKVAAAEKAPYDAVELCDRLGQLNEKLELLIARMEALEEQRVDLSSVITAKGTSLYAVWKSVAAECSLPLSERLGRDLSAIKTDPAALDRYFAEFVEDYEQLAPAQRPAKVAVALRYGYESDAALIGIAEAKWRAAAEYLQHWTRLENLYPDERNRTANEEDYRQQCRALAQVPSLGGEPGLAVGVALSVVLGTEKPPPSPLEVVHGPEVSRRIRKVSQHMTSDLARLVANTDSDKGGNRGVWRLVSDGSVGEAFDRDPGGGCSSASRLSGADGAPRRAHRAVETAYRRALANPSFRGQYAQSLSRRLE